MQAAVNVFCCNAKKHTTPFLKKGRSTPISTSVFLKNDVCTSTIIVVFSAIHDILSYDLVLCVLLRNIDLLYTTIRDLSIDKVKINSFCLFLLFKISKGKDGMADSFSSYSDMS